LDREYRQLLARYGQLHAGAATGTRRLAVRFYAFPDRAFPD
jgi:hypothetical protein